MLVSSIVQETIQQVQLRAAQENISIIYQSSANDIEINAGWGELKHDVSHLLNTLLAFMPASGVIDLELGANQNHEIILTITGSGVDLFCYTGVTKASLLPTRIIATNGDRTRYEISLGKALRPLAKQSGAKPISENTFYQGIASRLRAHFKKTENMLATLKDNPVEAAFMQRVNMAIYKNLSNVQFDVNHLADALNMSRTQLFRKLKPIIRQSASGYIRSMRLQKAKEMLETTDHRVSEVAYLTGFETLSNFTKVFVKAYGVKPSDISRYKPNGTNGQANATK